MAPKTILACLLASAVATLLSMVIALIVATVLPFRIGPELAQPIAPGTVLTEKEMKQAKVEAKARIERRLDSFRDHPFHVLPDVKRGGIAFSWLPWLLLPFFVRLKSLFGFAGLLTVPTILLLTPIGLAIEILTFGVALAVGMFLSRQFRDRRAGA